MKNISTITQHKPKHFVNKACNRNEQMWLYIFGLWIVEINTKRMKFIHTVFGVKELQAVSCDVTGAGRGGTPPPPLLLDRGYSIGTPMQKVLSERKLLLFILFHPFKNEE